MITICKEAQILAFLELPKSTLSSTLVNHEATLITSKSVESECSWKDYMEDIFTKTSTILCREGSPGGEGLNPLGGLFNVGLKWNWM